MKMTTPIIPEFILKLFQNEIRGDGGRSIPLQFSAG